MAKQNDLGTQPRSEVMLELLRLDVGSAIALVARDHVRLSYEYLDRDDVDGYVSLLAPDVELRRPGRVPVRDRKSTRLNSSH